jgi:hypothetical protein
LGRIARHEFQGCVTRNMVTSLYVARRRLILHSHPVIADSDEMPLLPATIKPDADSERLWPSLKARDPIFTRNIPPTEQALDFYGENLEKCLQSLGRNNEYAKADVLADASGKLAAIVFSIRQYQSLAKPK